MNVQAILRLISLSLISYLIGTHALSGQCETPEDTNCGMTMSQYDNVVIGEVSGDAGQSDGCNDGILEIVGPPGTNIGCMVATNSEWAVLIPANTLIPADGVFLIACSSDPTGNCGVGLTSSTNGLIADGLEGDFTAGFISEIDLDVCNSSNSIFYDPAATGFTIDNSSATDGDQIMLFRPNGTPHDGVYWGTSNMTSSGSTTVGGSSGNADHVTITISGQTYTLGDNDGDGIVNNNPTSVAGGRGDGGNATAVPLLPTSVDCPCNTPSSPGSFTMPSLDDPSGIWFNSNVTSPNSKGCNSSIIRLDSGTSAGGQNSSPSHTDGEVEDSALNPNGSNMDNGSAPGVAGDFGETTITSEGFTPNSFTPTSCGDPAAEWSYTDHPTPGQANDDPTFVFYASTDQQCTVGDMVTFTVEIYNYQNVSDNTDVFSGTNNEQTGSYVFDPITGSQVTWDTYTVSGETTTMTYTTTLMASGTFDFGLVWDDFSNCCGTTGLPNSQASPNECYETETITVEVVAPMVYDCNGDGIADDPQVSCVISCDSGPPEPGTINIKDFISGGSGLTFTLSDDSGTNADVVNTTGVFTLEDDVNAGPYTVTINDGSGCTATDLIIDIADNCETPPICPTDVVNSGTTPDGALCPGDMLELCLDGTDLPSGGEICWYTVPTSDATPDPATDDLLGCVTIPANAATVPSNTIPVINEVLFNPIDNDGTTGNNGEFIEIAAVPGTDISGWLVYDPDWSILLPAGTTIPASGFLVVGFAGGAELPTGKSVGLDVDLIDSDNIGGSPLTLVNSNELVGLSQPDGAGGFTFVTGVDYGGTDSDNVTPLGTNAGGGTYDFSGSAFTSGPTGEGNGESIGLIVDGDISSGYDESGDIPNSAEENTGGCPNSAAVMPIPCLTVTLDNSFCSGDIFINSLISGVPTSCPMGSNVGIGSDYSMSCPSATIVADAFDVCLSDMTTVDIPVTLTGLTSGTYRIGYQIDGGAEQFVTALGTSTSVNISITGPTTGEVKVTLSSVYNDIDGDGTEDTTDGECSGTINDAEVCVNIRPTPTGTVDSKTDPTNCMPCDGTVTFTFTGNGPFDFEYTIDGGAPLSVGAVSSPYILIEACPGVYDIVSVSDENSCPGTITSNPMTLAAPSGTPLTVTTQPAAVCNDGTGTVDLTTDVTYDPAFSAADFFFFGVDPNGLPIDVTNPSTFTGFTITSTYTAPANGTTVFALYIDPMSGCPSVASVNILTNADACFTCPMITTLSDPEDPCNGGTFDLTVSGLDADLMNQTSGGGPFGIEFRAISGAITPADAYVAMGTSLGIVANSNLANAGTEATVTGVGGTLASGDYQLCAILSDTPTDNMCRPQVCVSVTVNSVTCATFPWEGN